MSSLIKLINTRNGRMILNMAKVSMISVQGSTIKYSLDHSEGTFMPNKVLVARYDTAANANSEFDKIHTEMAAYYKIKDQS